jgi:tetratricopeptide (TPR) repeat protein
MKPNAASPLSTTRRFALRNARAACAAMTALLVATLPPTKALAQSGEAKCGNPFVNNNFGPFDYRSARKVDLKLVEDVHFTPRIEQLQKGERDLGSDLSYTLYIFPNHHRALIAITRLAQRDKTNQPYKSGQTIECWYDRAIRYRPDDTVVRVLFAQYLGKERRTDEAMAQLEVAAQNAKDNPFSHFNIGLLYFELGNHERALQQAHKAMALGMVRPELADMLKREGKWREPTP